VVESSLRIVAGRTPALAPGASVETTMKVKDFWLLVVSICASQQSLSATQPPSDSTSWRHLWN
jgi:hypothetical protein